MAMRETVRSLKAYLIIAGSAGLLVNFRGLSLSDVDIAFITASVISLGFSLAILYVGIRFRSLLDNRPGIIRRVLKAAWIFEVLICLMFLLGGVIAIAAVRLTIVSLLFWYLLRNLNRLSLERSKAHEHPQNLNDR